MTLICGMDEAGRGPLAGPLVAVAVVAPADLQIEAMDSKSISEKRRFSLAEILREQLEYHAEIISVEKAFANFIASAVLPIAVGPTTQISNGFFGAIRFLRGLSDLILPRIYGNILNRPGVAGHRNLGTLGY